MRRKAFGAAAAAILALTLTGAAPAPPGFAQSEIPVGAVADATERAQFSALIAEAQKTMRSQRFRDNMRSLAATYPQIHFRTHPSGAMLVLGSPSELLTVLDTSGPAYRYIRTPFSLTGQSNDYSPVHAGREGGGVDADGVALGSGSIPRGHLWNWNHANPVIRSCAINTIAHEISHTVVIDTATYRHAFTDFDRFSASAGAPSASYLVGTVAQCTWLQEQGRVGADGFAACVAVFGSRHFNGGRCGQFENNQLVAVRPDLWPAATDDEMRPRPGS